MAALGLYPFARGRPDDGEIARASDMRMGVSTPTRRSKCRRMYGAGAEQGHREVADDKATATGRLVKLSAAIRRH